MTEDIHNTERKYELNNKRFNNSEQVSEENKKAVSRFCDKCFAEGLSKARVKKYITNFHTVLKMAGKEFDLLDADQSDIEEVTAKIEQSDYAESTKADFKQALKKFYKVMEGNRREYPDKVRFISTTVDKTARDMPDVLDREEVDAIIEECSNDRDRAMYKLLYEGGLRAGELLSLDIGDVSFVENGVRLTVSGKTGDRQILVVESERYLRNWLSKHPFSDQRNAPLWVNIKRAEDKPPEETVRTAAQTWRMQKPLASAARYELSNCSTSLSKASTGFSPCPVTLRRSSKRIPASEAFSLASCSLLLRAVQSTRNWRRLFGASMVTVLSSDII
ncbi:MAG: tyrosine-type recombinase/integrase [Candidatus Nanohaloarchaea archaeon]|nr:tyrosine-type recombinase/integrase [Candidatus Nanohaloarchaea archaeon]